MRTVHPDKEYIVSVRRELNTVPEVGFELPRHFRQSGAN